MHFLNGAALDVVTFGMPVRYGWDPLIGQTAAHRQPQTCELTARDWLEDGVAPDHDGRLIAWGGDYVQELAVAGSDAMPTAEAANAANSGGAGRSPYDGFERWLNARAVRFP
jgi:hypothetical protein